MCQLRRVLQSGERIERQRFVLTTRDGRRVIVEASPIRNAKAELAGAAAVVRDVTERQRVERERDHLLRELERSNADLERFAYALAHDLQRPIRTVRILTDLLSRSLEAQLSPDDAEMLRLIAKAAKSMHRLIESLLEYALAGHGVLE